MRGERYIVFLIAAVLIAGCQREPELKIAVRECAPLPAGGRASARAAVLDGKAYVFAGRDSTGHYLNDLWQYNPETDTWTYVSQCPGNKRVNATIAAADGALYMGLGYSASHAYNDTAYLRDWWKYDPQNGQWTSLAQYPCANTIAPVTSTDGNDIHVYYGCGRFMSADRWRYNTLTNEWQPVPPGEVLHRSAFGCTGAALRGTLYFGCGFDAHNLTDWYSVELAPNKWRKRTSMPGKGREFAAAAASDEYIYVFGGRYFAGDMSGGEIFNTYLRYEPETDRWRWCGTMPCGSAENQVAFTIDGKAYFGLGENEKGIVINQLYCVEE